MNTQPTEPRLTTPAPAGAENLQILDTIADAFIAIDNEWRVAYVNESAKVLLARFNATPGRKIFDLFPELIGSEVCRECQRAVSEQAVVRFETLLQPLHCWFEVQGYPHAGGLLLSLRDIHGRKLAEEALLRSEDRFRALVENSPAAVALLSRDGAILYLSHSLLGYPQADLLGRVCFEFVHAEDLDRTRQLWAECISAPGKRGTARYRSLHRDGSWRCMEAVAVNQLAHPAVRAIVVNYHDVTERTIAESAALRLAAIVASSEDAIVAKTLDGIITDWNPGAERLYGYSSEEATGRGVAFLIPPDRLGEAAHIREKVRRGERVESYETTHVRKDGRTIEVSVTVSPIRNGTGQVVGVSSIARDITERKDTQRALQRALIHGQRNEASQRMLQILLHEVSNPLSGILGTLDLLEVGENPDAARPGHVEIRQCAERISTALNELQRRDLAEPAPLNHALLPAWASTLAPETAQDKPAGE